MKILFSIILSMCFVTFTSAADEEEGGLWLPSGIHQDAPYNSMLPSVNFTDTSTSGIPRVGCFPLALSRVMFKAWGVSPITNQSRFNTVLKAIHQNSANNLVFKNHRQTGVSPSDMESIIKRNGFEIQDFYSMPEISSMSSQRERISELYVWVRDKIKRGKPVISVSHSGQHAFVIDGYKTVNPYFGSEDLYLHVLWGWNPEDSGDAQWVQIDKGAGLGSWLEFSNHFVEKFFSDFSLGKASFLTLKERTDYKWTGNGSIISHSSGNIKNSFGITKDVAVIHPDSYSSVFFQWEVNKTDGKNLKVSVNNSNGDAPRSANIRYGTWSNRNQDRVYKNIHLPFTLDPSKNWSNVKDGDWFVVRVSFNEKISSSTGVYAKVTNEEALNDVALKIADKSKIDGFSWNGNASVISYNSGSNTGAGMTWDQIKIKKNSLGNPVVYFQWQIDKNDGQKLRITANGMGDATITYGNYNDRSTDNSYRHNFSKPFYLDPKSDGRTIGNGTWYVIKVAFDNKPNTSSVDVFARAMK